MTKSQLLYKALEAKYEAQIAEAIKQTVEKFQMLRLSAADCCQPTAESADSRLCSLYGTISHRTYISDPSEAYTSIWCHMYMSVDGDAMMEMRPWRASVSTAVMLAAETADCPFIARI